MQDAPDIAAVEAWLLSLQDRLTRGLEAEDGSARFVEERWDRAPGWGRTRVLADGAALEKGGVNFSHVRGTSLPAAATRRRPELAGQPYEALGVSLVLHPQNPYAPTTHLNVRLFASTGGSPAWWFGGGFDLTPAYGFDEDCVAWHRAARAACDPFGGDLYPRLKAWCDEYFQLPHRGEARGVGGLFFDDFSEGGFARAFEFTRSVGEAFLPAYRAILARRKATPFGDRERRWQLQRRGRYVEFNLLHDRGTTFGLQSGGRTESILMSMPPLVRWDYDVRPEPDSAEARLAPRYLVPRNWLDFQEIQHART